MTDNIKRKQVRFDMYSAYNMGVSGHPQQVMKDLGYTVLAGVAQSICDQWWFTVDKIIEPLPPYLSEMEYDYDYWHGNGRKIVW